MGIHLPANKKFRLMKLPPELEDHYVKEVLYNRSLENLPDEEWKLIEGYENYAISNYGRVKSLERWITDLKGRKRKAEDCIMQLQLMKFYNKYLNCNFYLHIQKTFTD